MAKDPVLPLYYNDISTSTQDWSDEEFGAYMRLLIHQWRQGGLPNDYQRLTRIATSLDRNWSLLKPKFPEADGLLKNGYMEDVRVKRVKHKEKQKENADKRYQKSTRQPAKNMPLEEEIENEIEEEVEDKLKEVVSRVEVFEALFSDEQYITDLSLAHSGKNIRQAFEECYIHHSNAPNPPTTLWLWRQKFNTWLSIKKSDNKNGNGFKNKQQNNIDGLIEDFGKRVIGGDP